VRAHSNLTRALAWGSLLRRFLLSTFVLSVAIMWLVLVLFTALVATPNLSLHWTFYWLTKELVQGLSAAFPFHRSRVRRSRKPLPLCLRADYWKHMVFLSSISLFIVAPFAFLYYEAEGFGPRSKGFSARFFETFVVLVLVTGIALSSPHLPFAVAFVLRVVRRQPLTCFVLSIWCEVLIYGSFRMAYSLWSGEDLVMAFSAFLSSNIGHNAPGMFIFMGGCAACAPLHFTIT
jgi:hypothetical protein